MRIIVHIFRDNGSAELSQENQRGALKTVAIRRRKNLRVKYVCERILERIEGPWLSFYCLLRPRRLF